MRGAAALWSGSLPRPLLSSFSVPALAAAAAAAPSLPRALLLDELWDGWLECAGTLGCVAVVTEHKLMDAALVEQLRRSGRQALVYTVNDATAARALLALGVGIAATRKGRVVAGKARGLVSGALPKDYDDWTLKAKVESELFRDEHDVKGAVNVNAQEGVVQLRGQLPSLDLIDALVERTRKIHGVKDVENLLHTPGTEAPMHH